MPKVLAYMSNPHASVENATTTNYSPAEGLRGVDGLLSTMKREAASLLWRAFDNNRNPKSSDLGI